jgi:hypothetical protein
MEFSMKVKRSTEMLHPILQNCIKKIQIEVIDIHDVPMRLFETGRDHDRHENLIRKGKTSEIFSKQLFNLEVEPPLYATAVEYVYYTDKWSWNLRDSTVMAWYQLFGNLVLDICPQLKWGGLNRKFINYCYFELRPDIVIANLDRYPCVIS